MDRFGPDWVGHRERIASSWRALVAPEDTVLVPGDISWALRLEEALTDLSFLGSLPGRKVISRGNHDYWWKSSARLAPFLPDGIVPLASGAMDMGGFVLISARGWVLPGSEFYKEERDARPLEREVARASESAAAAAALPLAGRPLVAMMHFPPTETRERTPFTDILSAAGVDVCVFGHLHGPADPGLADFELDGTRYVLCSSDQVGFRPVPVRLPAPSGGEGA